MVLTEDNNTRTTGYAFLPKEEAHDNVQRCAQRFERATIYP